MENVITHIHSGTSDQEHSLYIDSSCVVMFSVVRTPQYVIKKMVLEFCALASFFLFDYVQVG